VTAWSFVKEHWEELTADLPGLLRVYVAEGVRVLSTQELREDVAAFFEAHPLESGGRILEQALERQGVVVALREREAPRLTDAFVPGGSLAG
jgi:hypothetical protein